MDAKPDRHGDFLPDLCSVQAVFALVLVGELLALAMVLVDLGLSGFNWGHFGAVSMMMQWIMLSSAACLCPLRPWFRRQYSWVAGSASYLIVLIVTLVISLTSQLVLDVQRGVKFDVLLQHLFVSGLFAGVALRYFYIQQQLQNQQKAELLSRIQAMQSRIRPHFLFNSMNSIASLIAISPPKAEKMVEDLSQLFRASLQEPGMVSLWKELDLCRSFAGIEQIRLGDRLSLEWQLPEREVLEAIKIPSFLLQPLVENAIYHGVQPIPEGGLVNVEVAVGEYVEVRIVNPVIDNTEPMRQGNGMAMQNIRNRLSAIYGQSAFLRSMKREGRFMVHLKYPVDKLED